MENGNNPAVKTNVPAENVAGRWQFGPNETLPIAASRGIAGVLNKVSACVDETSPKPLITLGHGDPSLYSCFRTTPAADDALVKAVRSAKHNHYSPFGGVLPARRAVAEYLSKDLAYALSPDDVFITVGCQQAAEIAITALARPSANILIPKPGYPLFEARCALDNVEFRRYSLIPEKGWEVDLDQVEQLCDENTVAIVLINPNNPCGNVYTYQHQEKIAKTARKLGILVISDEVYGHLVFGNNPFVPMGVFGDIVPVITLGSISKRWVVPGWRLGWIAATDPNGILNKTKVVDSIKMVIAVTSNCTATFIQEAASQIFEKTDDEFFSKIIYLLRESVEKCFNVINEINCITCPHKSEGAMFLLVKLDLSCLEDINDDVDFCNKLAKEESLIICPGSIVDMKNWLRICFAVDPANLDVGLERLKAFCLKHEKRSENI